MRDALSAHQLNGFDQRVKGGKLPNLTVDMGYNSKEYFDDACMDLGYAPVVRFPKHWNTLWASDSTAHTVRGVPAGPAQIAGDFYCPAAAQLTDGKKLVRRTTDMLDENAGFDNHDRTLQRLLPFLMGTNSRPYKASRPGRPKTVDPDREKGMRIDLVCPAVQGRVRCPLKPESLVKDTELAPTVTPTWTADRYRCCANSQVTVAYSKDQWRMAAWGMTPGSWEHTVYFEAARALNEQRFSILKSMHVTGFSDLKWAARREPFVKIIIALMVASANKRVQDSWKQHPSQASSITKRMNQLEASLGRTPMKRPPRT
ncbi:hypothetical protein [Corynebacterium dentalis]|uniref:hypothetical protein n=1 Tax=Corynebacterium dentalis TaxID=2014528 RepID=UPI0028A2A9E9|nr:hypothetical protein [Corynebacterium dentalis]